MGAFSDFFKPKAELDARDAANAAATNTNANANQNRGASAIQNTPIDPNKIPGSVATPPNPLDVYKKMLDTAASANPDQAPVFDIDGTVLAQVADTLDFTAGIPKETMDKAMTGDVAAFMEVIKVSGREAYKSALSHQAKLTNAHLGQRSTFDDKRVGASVKTGLVDQALSSIPNYSHPVAKAELKRVADAMARDNPDQSPADIAKAAHEYLIQVASAVNPVQPAAGKDASGANLEMDWSSYLK